MTYREPLPEDCPPSEAEEVAGMREVYRLVRNNPPAELDFRSQRAVRMPYSRCRSGDVRDCERARKLPALRGRLICRVQLITGAGRIQPTGRPSHHTCCH